MSSANSFSNKTILYLLLVTYILTSFNCNFSHSYFWKKMMTNSSITLFDSFSDGLLGQTIALGVINDIVWDLAVAKLLCVQILFCLLVSSV